MKVIGLKLLQAVASKLGGAITALVALLPIGLLANYGVSAGDISALGASITGLLALVLKIALQVVQTKFITNDVQKPLGLKVDGVPLKETKAVQNAATLRSSL